MKGAGFLLIFAVLFGFFYTLFSPEAETEAKEESLPEGFVLVNETQIKTQMVYQLKHLETGCHYMSTEDIRSSGGLVQMYVKDSVNHIAIPYCENNKEVNNK